ncbi:hypothetical protein EX30DRAFT_66385 [Ascodesmis nigricans]|uniref:Uncharacterized protein n=1 Tax=Ascodesmis nigricans TaxID=341454 RepID=A0A4S2MU20_9PEZI|nr:hypothetical protein EX30DRAFT_66385 [Ascodesmis nigricans]
MAPSKKKKNSISAAPVDASGICTAIHIRTKLPCTTPRYLSPTAPDGIIPLFCKDHVFECAQLYKKYKQHQATLEMLEDSPPRDLPADLGNNTFEELDGEGPAGRQRALERLERVWGWCRERYNLLDRCITAREIHHEHFYKDTSDFGHQAYLDRLRTNLRVMETALTRLAKRKEFLTFQETTWYMWISKIQADEDARSESERKRVRAAAVLMRQHQTEQLLQLKIEEDRAKLAAENSRELWDPIEYKIQEVRRGYIALLRAQICATNLTDDERAQAKKRAEETKVDIGGDESIGKIQGTREEMIIEHMRKKGMAIPEQDIFKAPYEAYRPAKEDKEDAAARKQAHVESDGENSDEWPNDEEVPHGRHAMVPESIFTMSRTGPVTMDGPGRPKELDNPAVIKLTQDFNAFTRSLRPGTIDFKSTDPQQIELAKTEIRRQVRDIREYMFLRLVISQPSLFRVGLECNSIDEFLHNDSVSNSDLRDLSVALSRCKMESIRDACADYWLNQVMTNPDEVGEESVLEEKEEFPLAQLIPDYKEKAKMREAKLEAKMKKNKKGKGKKVKEEIDIDEPEQLRGENHLKDRVKVCGRWLHNFPAETRLPRRGWYQLGIVAPTLSWNTALSLCNSWDECYELNLLAMSGYFNNLAFNWTGSRDPQYINRTRMMGFLTYHHFPGADQTTVIYPKSTGHGTFHAREARNFVCGCMGRDVEAARRFIAMCATTTSELIVYVKDMCTGKVIYEPPPEQAWLMREKQGRGRIHRVPWTIVQSIDANFRKDMDQLRPWKLQFTDYMEIILADRHPGRNFNHLIGVIIKYLHKAHQHIDLLSIWQPTIEVYQRIAQDEDGKDGPRAQEARSIRRQIRALRKKPELKKLLMEPHPSYYYDSIDEHLDLEIMAFKDPFWKRPENMKESEKQRFLAVQARLDELAEMPDNAGREEMVQLAATMMADHFISHHRKKREREYAYDDEEEGGKLQPLPEPDEIKTLMKQPDVVEDDGDSDWEDEKPDMKRMVEMYEERIYEEAEDLMGLCEDLGDEMHEIEAEHRGFDPRAYEKGRNFMRSLLGKEDTLNQRDRARALRRQKQIMNQANLVIPKNYYYCMLIVDMLWPARIPSPDIKSDNKSFEDLKMGTVFEGIDPKEFTTLREHTLRSKYCGIGRPNQVPPRVHQEWEAFVETEGLSDQGWCKMYNADEIFPKDWVKYILERVFDLWHDGIIRPSYRLACVPAYCGKDVHGHIGMFIDYQLLLDSGQIRLSGEFQDPPPPDYIMKELEAWEEKNPNSCYSLLRMKSSPEYWHTQFYPSDTALTSFVDPRGRIWEFTKYPKDYPGAAAQFHEIVEEVFIEPPNLRRRDRPEEKIRYWTRHRVDVILVMGRTQKECREWTIRTCAYLRKRPVGLDVDFTKSWLGCTAEEIRELAERGWVVEFPDDEPWSDGL